ncbi:T-cell surface glycoprotein CD8 alpha chain [Acomys russatus]|uniref:T-cell surface glycoprotein CD8 alpha chain n=1 Tax=Acomys russatus TaxID=60746 RepID=UPI0021E31156|nr:T-cell surface glycoprotein CD8 alpha chain [Acomys russatus]
MDLLVTCFVLLTLLLEVTGIQEMFQMLPTKLDAQLGQKLELTCEVRQSTTVQGCSWLFQSRSSTTPKPIFIAYTSTSRFKLGEKVDEKLFSARKSGSKYILTLSKFSTEHEGYYFCSATSNSMMYFSPLVPVFLPGPFTTIPVRRSPTPVPPIGTTRPLRPGTCRPVAGGSVEWKGLDFACDIYIWAPLAGICGVLLLSLVTTLICCHSKFWRVPAERSLPHTGAVCSLQIALVEMKFSPGPLLSHKKTGKSTMHEGCIVTGSGISQMTNVSVYGGK